ncbi:unnamed protein product [Candida verbasci]|uniref:Uncharacterized protein n=1 Tax=Candida verbasci TaxID=1227364 RepID=A0A9W4XCG1_9ASCO|nr:unnamed protein product [Candida verbasci]
MSLTSKEVNYIIYRYLQESGYDLSAYALDQQSQCSKYGNEDIRNKIKPGCLISLIQKGILYTIAESEVKSEQSLTFLGSLINNDLDSITEEEIIRSQKQNGKQQLNEPEVIIPNFKFNSSLTSDWYEDKIVYGKENNAIIIINNDDEIILSHPLNIVDLVIFHEFNLWSCAGSEIRVWSPDGKLKNITNLQEGIIIKELLWNDSNQYLMVLDSNNTVTILDSVTLSVIKKINSSELVTCCWLSCDKFAITTSSNNIKIFDIESLKPIGILNGHEHIISLLKFDKQTKLLASCSETDYNIKIWNSSSSCLDLIGKKHTSPIIELCWNNGLLYSISIEGIINIWNDQGNNLKNGKLVNNLIYIAKLSPNGKLLAIGDDNGKVLIFNENLHLIKVYQPEMMENSGICDLKWNLESNKLLCSYNVIDSVVLNV